MPTAEKRGNAHVRSEARVLYSLLDAAEGEGLLEGAPVATGWLEAKARVRQGASYESEAEVFYELMSDLDQAGRITGTWIEERWWRIRSRVPAAGGSRAARTPG